MSNMSSDFFQSIVRKIFGKDEPEQVAVPLVTEKLVRNGAFAERYAAWKDSADREVALTILRSVWDDLGANTRRKEMDFFKYVSPQSNGFFFNPNLGIPNEVFTYLLDYFKDVLIENGYQLYMSDRRYSDKPQGVECIERHYLKPGMEQGAEFPVNQRFGNIIVEYYRVDDKPSYLKLMANVYSDRNYTKALPFSTLADLLFE